MRVFRGPSSVPFPDELHELVSTSDLSTMATIVDGAVVICANVTKLPNERQSLAHIELDFSDIISLQNKLLAELMARSKECDRLRSKIKQARTHVYEIFNAVTELTDESLSASERQSLLDMTDAPLNCLDLDDTKASRKN